MEPPPEAYRSTDAGERQDPPLEPADAQRALRRVLATGVGFRATGAVLAAFGVFCLIHSYSLYPQQQLVPRSISQPAAGISLGYGLACSVTGWGLGRVRAWSRVAGLVLAFLPLAGAIALTLVTVFTRRGLACCASLPLPVCLVWAVLKVGPLAPAARAVFAGEGDLEAIGETWRKESVCYVLDIVGAALVFVGAYAVLLAFASLNHR